MPNAIESEPTTSLPPVSNRPPGQPEPDPLAELQKLAEQLARAHNRRLLHQYLTHRRMLR